MRAMKLLSIFLLACVLLCGCQVSGELENQAYVLVLGVDRMENDRICLTARVPKIGKDGSNQQDGPSGDAPYLTFTVAVDSWARALEALQQATPRRMNLSHIELLIFSEAIASEPGFPALMREIARTPHLYTTAHLVICRGEARAFVEAGETVIGTRMSAELQAMLKHYADQGYIPEASFADADFAANTCYSDPVAIFGYLETNVDDSGDGQVLKTPMKQRFLGAALLRQGVFIRTLSLEETRWLNLVRGRKNALPIQWEGRDYALTPIFSPRRQVAWNGSQPTLSLQVGLSLEDSVTQERSERLAGEVKRRLETLVRSCQAERCDPFGFAEIAAGHFQTTADWLACDWRGLYAVAPLNIDVAITSAG